MVLIVLGIVAACAAETPSPDSPSAAGEPPPARGCTQIGCVNGFTLRLASEAPWPAGAYRFVITADGETTTCEGKLPLPDCAAGRALTCSGPSLLIGESGCALPPSAHGFSEIQMSSAPGQVTVEISRDGTSLAEADFSPSYVESRPNGPGCEPVCRSASATLNVK
ncbi:hypothetical protein WME98_08080 [Sorangium sp. So ce296]|uniref:hypothetical protein n=1 Tax=Sorangium sp. So ce296 TaxID=3133296 RepID=UPI003F6161D9